MRKVLGHGPEMAEIMIVGEAPGKDEELEGKPFVGQSGRELTLMLREAGIDRKDCYVTNVVKYRPPANKIETWVKPATKSKKARAKAFDDGFPHEDGERWYNDFVAEGRAELLDEIARVNPKVIIGLGNIPLWALAGEWGITNWRGSEMTIKAGGREIPFVPTLHPAAVLRNWGWRYQVVHDLKMRVARRLQYGFKVPQFDHECAPTFEQAMSFIASLSGDVAADIETTRNKVACIGLATSATRAMCIPFINAYNAYWNHEQEEALIEAICNKLSEPTVTLIGQNWNYDESVIEGTWGRRLVPQFDTMIAQSVAYPGQPRGLGFLGSMYCDWYCYWKEDAKDWNNIKDFPALFKYNCRDCCHTFEVAQSLKRVLERLGQWEQFQDRMDYSRYVFTMQQRGVLRSEATVNRLDDEIEDALQERALLIADKAGRVINFQSPKQVSTLLYEDWGLPKIMNKKSKVPDAVSTDDEALKALSEKHPEQAPYLLAIMEHRSLSSIRANFLRAKTDPDGMLRSSFLPTGTETFRLTSSKNCFKRGANLLNITAGEGHAQSGLKLPNLRKCIVPPPGYTIFDMDLSKADAQVVVWEADDTEMKQMLREGVNIHKENAVVIFGLRSVADVTDQQYAFAKRFVHLTNYGGTARTAAIKCGTTVHAAMTGQKRWFGAHPGILKWQERVERELTLKRQVSNKFGFRMVYFDRPDALLGQALAWGPQSTVAIVASKVHTNIEQSLPEALVWLQMYDSVMGIYPTELEDWILPQLQQCTQVVVPYDDPLIIPMGLKTSIVSWGECEKREWPEAIDEREVA